MPTTYHAGPCPITGSPTSQLLYGQSGDPVTAFLEANWLRDPVFRGEDEQLTILASVAGTWAYHGQDVTDTQIYADFHAKDSINPVVSSQRIQTDKTHGPNLQKFGFDFDPDVAIHHNVNALEAIILNEETHEYLVSVKMPLSLRRVEMTAHEVKSFLRKDPTFRLLRNGLGEDELPAVHPYHLSKHELGCLITPYEGAGTSQVTVAFYDGKNKADSDLMARRSETFKASFTGRHAIHCHFGYATDKQGNPLHGHVTVIAYVNGVPSAPVRIEVPG